MAERRAESIRTQGTVTFWGARILEGVANGLSVGELSKALDIPPYMGRDYCQGVYTDLVTRYTAAPRLLAISKLIAAGLFKKGNMQTPGKRFAFTLEADKQSPIGLRDNLDRSGNVVRWPRSLKQRLEVPGLAPSASRITSIPADVRTLFSCASLGMGFDDMAEQGYAKSARSAESAMGDFYPNLAAINIAQATTHANFLGVIGLPDDILTLDSSDPIKYTKNRVVDVRPLMDPQATA